MPITRCFEDVLQLASIFINLKVCKHLVLSLSRSFYAKNKFDKVKSLLSLNLDSSTCIYKPTL